MVARSGVREGAADARTILLRKIKDRVVLEVRLEKEGILVPKAHPERATAE